jgi:hypothetical protein
MLEVSVIVTEELNKECNDLKISREAFGGVAITISEFSYSFELS